jgi:hypothetical protein
MRVSQFVFPMLLATSALAVPTASRAQLAIGISVTIAPPALPIYEQPPIPDVGYIWTPGYWAYGDAGYYWVPGTWVQPPSVGVLWTPGYWGWNSGAYVFNAGYWGPHVGFYGGINYGYGYGGNGYEGGRWDNGAFAYNRAVNNFGSTRISNVYEQNVTHTTINNVSYNGGNGGIGARPSAEEQTFAHEQHVPPTPAQASHFEAARGDRSLLASVNHGQPPVAATARPGEFHGPGVVQARGANPAAATAERAQTAPGPRDPAHPEAARAPGPAIAHAPAAARPGEPARAEATHAPATAAARPQIAARPAEVAHAPAARATQPQVAARSAQAAHAPAAQVVRPQVAARPAQPAHVAVAHAAPPQQHAAAPRPQPQQHAAAPRPQPQQHAAAPRPVAHAAPAPEKRPQG